jgi:hypothetical protein
MENTQNQTQKLVLLNGLALNMFPRTVLSLRILPLQPEELRRLATNNKIIHFIRHGATIAALRSIVPHIPAEVNAGFYKYERGDTIVVVTLRMPARGQEVSSVNPDDLDLWLVEVL